MKKAIKINLSGYIFHIDEDAYFLLQDYLRGVGKQGNKTNGGKEVLEDIESRIAELFKAKITEHYQVININDVKEVIDTIGKPSDFDDTKSSSKHYYREGDFYRKRKRLYRDVDNKTLGGVCSGLGHYFDVDVVLMRVIFVILFFVTVGFILYLVCWIVIPPADTEAERDEMLSGGNRYSNRY